MPIPCKQTILDWDTNEWIEDEDHDQKMHICRDMKAKSNKILLELMLESQWISLRVSLDK